MNNIVKTILSILLSIGLCVLIFFEFKFGFDTLHKRIQQENTVFISASADEGKSRVTIDTTMVYTEIPTVEDDCDVLFYEPLNLRIKVRGALTNTTAEVTSLINNEFTYSHKETSVPSAIFISSYNSNVAEAKIALDNYFHDDPAMLLEMLGTPYMEENLTLYQQTYRDGNIPFIYNDSTGTYYAFIIYDKEYAIVNSSEYFNITNEKPTVHYGDPSANPQLSHTYSDYETLATENTLNQLKGKDSESSEKNPYVSEGVAGTAETYTSSTDNSKRKQMTLYANYVWKEDGTSDETSLKVDLTSDEAMKSEWKLTSTQYAYTTAGLKISSLVANKNADTFTIEGNINNMLDAERPYVLIIKFLSEDRKLVALRVIDKRTEPINSKDVTTFSSALKAEDKVDVSAITSIQFEIY